jgi:LemA protein
MQMGIQVIVVLVVLVIGVVVWGVALYNSLVALRNRVENGWSQIDVQLKRRIDLVPNLVQVVKGYASHESALFEKVTAARAAAMQSASSQASTADRAAAESNLSRVLMNLTATAESYPELKANQNFLDLQEQLSGIEEKIAYARQFYNDVVQKFNTKIEMFPSNIVAGMFHFSKAEYFRADESEKAVPQVQF